MHSTTRRKVGADGGSCTLTNLRSPASRAGASASSATSAGKLVETEGLARASRLALRAPPAAARSRCYAPAPPQPVRAARLQRAAIAAVRLAPKGRPLGSPFALLRAIAISVLRTPSATSRKKGLGRDSHPRPSPYEGAALTAAPPSHAGRRPRSRTWPSCMSGRRGHSLTRRRNWLPRQDSHLHLAV